MVTVRKCYCDSAVYGTTKIKSKSIVEPGQSLPMNKLIKGVINGSIVINPRFMEYDYPESVSDEFDAVGTPSEIAKQQNDAFVAALDKQSDVPADPTASPVFDAVDAENLANAIADVQAASEGGSAQVGAADEPLKAQGSKPVTKPSGSLSSGEGAAEH